MSSVWLLAAQAVDDDSLAIWSGTSTPLIISIACIVMLFIASRTIQRPHVGPKMPLGPFSGLFNDISAAGFIAAMSFGHIVGTLAVLGLAR